MLLALLQDDAKNQSSYLTWKEAAPQSEVAARSAARLPGRRRSAPISSPAPGDAIRCWAACICRPIARARNTVAGLRRRYSPECLLPVLYGCRGLVDVTTIDAMLEEAG